MLNATIKPHRGSEWRKWDLQVQTYIDPRWVWPNDYPTGDDKVSECVTKFHSDLINHCVKNEITTIAITDHNSGDAIDGLLSKNQELEYPITILPGVEVISSEGIHLVIIFNPLATENRWANWAETIRQFLTAIDMPQPAFHSDGNNTPATSRKSAEKIILEVQKFDGVTFFAHAHSTNGGLFCKSDSRTRQRLLGICNILDAAADPSDLVSRVSTLNTELTNHQVDPKEYAIINTSDSRRIEDIGNHYTWVKADPTFEGLKQIIFEPKERVRIQGHNPYDDRSKIYFNVAKLSGSTNFILPDFELLLNRELVAIIGGRGSGKSALLDTFAFLNEEHLKVDRNNKKKIIEYYRDNENRTEPPPSYSLNTTLIDKDGVGHSFSKILGDYTNYELPFLYLGQEQLSGIATNDFELTRTVCQLIGIDINEVGQEVLISKARAILSGIDNTEKLITDIIQRYVALGYPQTKKLATWINEYLTKLREQETRLSSKETRTILEEINKKTQQGLKLKDLSEKAEILLGELKNISVNQSIKNFNAQLKKLYENFPSIITLDASEQIKALGDIKQKIKSDMDELRKDIISQKQKLIKQGIKEDVNSLLQASENLQKQISAIEADLQSYNEAQTQLKTLHQERDNLLIEIKKILEQVRDSITTAFVEFQGSRTDSSQEERELFEKMIGGIGVDGQIVFDEKVFAKKVLTTFIDNRTISSEAELKKLVAGENADGTSRDITFDNLSAWVQSNLSAEKCFNRGGLKGFVEFVFTEWPSFLRVKAVAKLNGRPTEVLSIGQRGTLLLKVYLATSTAKQVFIIDQPEDNLDNNFIMHELVPLIRRAKHSRQIIMSTHNANLVVNADAEQIVVALLDQGKSYFSGGIEDPDINEAIKDILEGGEQAFMQREKRYQIK